MATEIERFNPNSHLMVIGRGDKAKDYLPVQWRLVWFREQCPEGTIETEMIHLDLDRETQEDFYGYNAETKRNEKITRRAAGFAIFKATVKDGAGGIATGTKSEGAASFPDYIEKAETGAIGRALAALGYGTQFAPELNEEHRIVDAPVDSPPAPEKTPQRPQATPQNGAKPAGKVTPIGGPVDRSKLAETKKRAQALGLAKDRAEWQGFVSEVMGAVIPDEIMQAEDLQKINARLDEEAKQQKAS